MKIPTTHQKFGGSILLAIAAAAAAALLGATVSASSGSSSDDPMIDRCVSTADAAAGWLENGGTLPSCAHE